MNDPTRVTMTCYRILSAARDPRARQILEAGYHLLQEKAARLDESARSSFLENVPSNRELLEEWESQDTRDHASCAPQLRLNPTRALDTDPHG
jgi:hypothetical protein